MYLENERRRNGEKQMNVSCHIFQCSNFLAFIIPEFLGVALGVCFVLQGSESLAPSGCAHSHCLLWSQNDAVGRISYFMSDVEA